MSKSAREQIDEIIKNLISSYSTENQTIWLKEMDRLLDDLEVEAFTRGIQAEYWNS